MKDMPGTGLIVLLFTHVTSAQAQDIDCKNPQDQASYNECAYREWQAEDKKLNAAYKATMGRLPGSEKTALRNAQRIWISKRDTTCEHEGKSFEGGSMQPQVINACRAEITRTRTQEILQLAK